MPDPRFFAESPESVGIDPEKLEALFARAAAEVEAGLLPSSQIAVARNGRIAGMRTVGTATFQGKPGPASDETLYCIFSCTKAITSAAAWLLIQEGKLGIDEVVADIVPEFGTNGKEAVTVEQLFIHTAGFPNAPFRPEEFHDRSRRLERFSRWRLSFEPGSRFIYHPSSSMYVVAEIVERRSGTSYRDFVRERIALPLGLPDLQVGLPAEQQGRLADIVHVGVDLTAEDYERLGFPAPPVTEVNEDNIQRFNDAAVRESGIPGGGGTATAGDLALFYQALLDGGRAGSGREIWQPATLAMARENRTGELTDPIFGKPANRGLGLMLAGGADRNFRGFGHTNSEHAFGHGGAGGQIAWADPATGISLGYCTNGYDRDPIRQARRGIGISSRAAACVLA